MNRPARRMESRFLHFDSRDLQNVTESSFAINFGTDVPIQDYNNVVQIELKVMSAEKPATEDYALFKIKNIDGKVDSTNQQGDITTVVYFEDNRKPVFFGGNKFEFQPPISKLNKLNIDVLTRDGTGNFVPMDVTGTKHMSFLLKITYIEGNFY